MGLEALCQFSCESCRVDVGRRSLTVPLSHLLTSLSLHTLLETREKHRNRLCFLNVSPPSTLLWRLPDVNGRLLVSGLVCFGKFGSQSTSGRSRDSEWPARALRCRAQPRLCHLKECAPSRFRGRVPSEHSTGKSCNRDVKGLLRRGGIM